MKGRKVGGQAKGTSNEKMGPSSSLSFRCDIFKGERGFSKA